MKIPEGRESTKLPSWKWPGRTSIVVVIFFNTHLEVLQGELQHVPEDVAEDLRLALHQHIFIVQRLDHLRLHLEEDRVRETPSGGLQGRRSAR